MIGRIVVGIGWFYALWYGGLYAGGALLGAYDASGYTDVATAAKVAQAASAAFRHQYAEQVWQLAIVAAAIGTVTGRLPGTKW